MYLWIFRLILFFPNLFPDTAPCNFLEAGKGGQEFVKFPCFAVSWLSLCWLRSSVSLPFTYFPAFVGFSLWGLKCFHCPNPWILLCKGDGEKGSSWDWAEPSAAVCDFSVLYARSPCDRGPPAWTSALEGCCLHPHPACPARLGTSQIWRLQVSEAGGAAARFLWRQKWKMRDS